MRWTTLMAVVGVAAGWMGQSRGATVVDQSNLYSAFGSPYGISTAYSLAETFRVGVKGQLTGIALQVFSFDFAPAPTQDLLVDIRKTTAGSPQVSDSPVLASVTIAAGQVPRTQFNQPLALTTVDLTAFHLNVNPGEVYAIVLRSNEPSSAAGGFWWAGTGQGENPYAAGSAFQRMNASGPQWNIYQGAVSTDLGFQTFVAPVPLPAGFWPGAGTLAGMGVLLWARRRDRGHSFGE